MSCAAISYRSPIGGKLKTAVSIVANASDSTKKFGARKPLRAQNKPKGWIYGARWADIPCEARACKIVVAPAPPSWWCADLVGDERKAIEIKFDGKTVYVDNHDGQALETMLRGFAPLPGFRFLPAYVVRDDEEAKVFYKAMVA